MSDVEKPVVRIIFGSESDKDKGLLMTNLFKELEIPYSSSVASCHRNHSYLSDFIERIEEPIIVNTGGMAFAAPGIIESILVEEGMLETILVAVPLDQVAQDSVETLPFGTAVLTCGYNKINVDHGIKNAALAVARLLVSNRNIDQELANRISEKLSEYYLDLKKRKPLIENFSKGGLS